MQTRLKLKLEGEKGDDGRIPERSDGEMLPESVEEEIGSMKEDHNSGAAQDEKLQRHWNIE